MAYNTDTPINLSNYNKPKKNKVFGVKKKKRKDKERPGRQAGVATAIAGSLYFGLNPLAKALGFGSPGKMKGSPYHMNYKDSPMNKALVGKQHNLPEHLKKKIEAAPQMKGSPYHMSNELKYGGPVIDQMQTLSQASASKVLRHMKK